MSHGPEIEARWVREGRRQVSAHHQREIGVLESNTGTGRERQAIPPGCVNFGSARKESKQTKKTAHAISAPTLSGGDNLGGECGPSLYDSFTSTYRISKDQHKPGGTCTDRVGTQLLPYRFLF